MGAKLSSKKEESQSCQPRQRRTGEWERVRLLLLGDELVGKTSLLITFATNNYPSEYLPRTFENYTTPYLIDDQNIHLHTWDTGRDEDYGRGHFRPIMYPETDVFLVCFSVASPSSFESIKTRWIPEICHYCPGALFIVVAMKTDLRESEEIMKKLGEEGKEIITPEQGHQMAHEVGAIQYMECSSLTHQKGLKELFEEAMRIGLGDEPSVQSWIGKRIKGAKGR